MYVALLEGFSHVLSPLLWAASAERSGCGMIQERIIKTIAFARVVFKSEIVGLKVVKSCLGNGVLHRTARVSRRTCSHDGNHKWKED